MKSIDKTNVITSLRGDKKSLGAFISAVTWSPDGTKAFILSENVSAILQDLQFFSPKRDPDSLNWWLYDLKMGEATLLDQKILSIGWMSNSLAVYNWNNTEIDTAPVENLSLRTHQKVADIQNDTTDLKMVLSPVYTEEITLVPLEKGFYAVTPSQGATYFSLPNGVQKITVNPFDRSALYIQSGNTLFSFSSVEKKLASLDTDFTAIDFSFLDKNTLAIADKKGSVFSYAIATKEKKEISLGGYGNIMQILQGNEGSFVFVSGDNTYIQTLTSDVPISFSENSEDALIFSFEKLADNSITLKSGNSPSIVKKRDSSFSLTKFLKNTPASGEYQMDLYEVSGALAHTFYFSGSEDISFSYAIPYFQDVVRFTVSETSTGKLFLDGELKQFLPCSVTNTCPKGVDNPLPLKNEPTGTVTKNPSSPTGGVPVNTPEVSTTISPYLIALLVGIFLIIFLGTFLLIRYRLK